MISLDHSFQEQNIKPSAIAEIGETIDCACAKSEQRICSLKGDMQLSWAIPVFKSHPEFKFRIEGSHTA